MKRLQGDFRVRARANGSPSTVEFVNGQHFAINPSRISSSLEIPMTIVEDDLVRVGMAIYVIDRSVRRAPALNDRVGGRELELEISVSNPDLWNAQADLVARILAFLSGDAWRIRFVDGLDNPAHDLFLFPPTSTPSRVCLYSAGLDSLAGLAIRLSQTSDQYYCVTARHRSSLPPPLRAQYRRLTSAFGQRLTSVIVPTTLLNADRLDRQELSQRCRAFLFCALGASVASRVGVTEVEIFENGVGALNVPPMNGMLWGGRATRGSHPHFLRLMSNLATSVLGRPISFVLPFKWWTKAQMVGEMHRIGLGDAVRDAVSCVHYPRRVIGSAKQCGLCPACLGSRQAVIAAGLEMPTDGFENDILDSKCNSLSPDDLADLRQHILQVADFHQLAPDGSQPQVFRRHLITSQAVTMADTSAKWANLLSQYRSEWMNVAMKARERGCRWPQWLDGCCIEETFAAAGGHHE